MPIVRFLMDREMWGQTGRSPISDCLKLANHFGQEASRAEYIALVCIGPAVEVLVVDVQEVIAEGLITEKMITVRVVTQRQPIRCGGWTS